MTLIKVFDIGKRKYEKRKFATWDFPQFMKSIETILSQEENKLITRKELSEIYSGLKLCETELHNRYKDQLILKFNDSTFISSVETSVEIPQKKNIPVTYDLYLANNIPICPTITEKELIKKNWGEKEREKIKPQCFIEKDKKNNNKYRIISWGEFFYHHSVRPTDEMELVRGGEIIFSKIENILYGQPGRYYAGPFNMFISKTLNTLEEIARYVDLYPINIYATYETLGLCQDLERVEVVFNEKTILTEFELIVKNAQEKRKQQKE